MVECPRCGFIQPEDRYCANCGLDGMNYKPQPVPLYQRILNNTMVQLTAALLIVASLIFGLYKNQQDHVAQTMNQAEESQQNVQASGSSTVSARILPSRPKDISDPVPEEAIDAAETEEPESESLDMPATEKSGSELPASTPTAASAAPEVEVPIGKTVAFTVSLVELSRDMLTGLSQVKPVKQWAQTKAWLITNFQGGQELSTFSQSLAPGQTWNIEIPNKDRGLQIAVTPLPGSTEAHLKIKVRTYFHWPSERAGESKGNEMTIEGPFDIPSQNHLIITGIIRRLKNLTLTEATLVQDTPLALMTSENFQNNQSDLALTIQ